MIYEAPDAELGTADIASNNRISVKREIRFRGRKHRARFLRWSTDHVATTVARTSGPTAVLRFIRKNQSSVRKPIRRLG